MEDLEQMALDAFENDDCVQLAVNGLTAEFKELSKVSYAIGYVRGFAAARRIGSNSQKERG